MNKTYHVVRILDEYRLVVNCGLDDGVSYGTILEAFNTGVRLIDPVTGEDLGELDSVSATLFVTKAHDRFSICVSNEVEDSPIVQALMTNIGQYSQKRKELPIDFADIEGVPGGRIKVGDSVRVVSHPILKEARQPVETEQDCCDA